jgi:hypothetical protein
MIRHHHPGKPGAYLDQSHGGLHYYYTAAFLSGQNKNKLVPVTQTHHHLRDCSNFPGLVDVEVLSTLSILSKSLSLIKMWCENVIISAVNVWASVDLHSPCRP